MPEIRLSPRERLVLNAIIDLYIATGEPVASQAVARFFENREGLSSATVRNVMATLGENGLLEQPHTSAGACRPRRRFVFTWSRSRAARALPRERDRSQWRRWLR